jgi:hypothetical protein
VGAAKTLRIAFRNAHRDSAPVLQPHDTRRRANRVDLAIVKRNVRFDQLAPGPVMSSVGRARCRLPAPCSWQKTPQGGPMLLAGDTRQADVAVSVMYIGMI